MKVIFKSVYSFKLGSLIINIAYVPLSSSGLIDTLQTGAWRTDR
jgi:hypothetical protein